MSSEKSPRSPTTPRPRVRGETVKGAHPADKVIRRERFPYAAHGPLGRFRQWLGGSSIASHRALHERLDKRKALAVFSSDALSSVAYATQEILLQLVVLGSVAFIYTGPIAILIALLLLIVAISYRQTIKAYPTGGGSFIVARENLGTLFGLTAGVALMISYVLTVAVSVSSGVDAIVSAFPIMRSFNVLMAIGFVLILAVMNWRGLRESSNVFALPTYAFIVSIAVLVVAGLTRYFVPILRPELPPQQIIPPHSTDLLVAWVLLKAFAAGCTALTGVEAIADGVPAFKPPESQNAARTLGVMAAILISMFIGITTLSQLYPIVPTEDGETILSQIARIVFQEPFLYPAYLFLQISTTLILVLAANTAFADFPRLSAIIARAGFMPRLFVRVGHRLVFSTGIFVLAFLSILLVILFKANTHNLLPLYAVGVFISFTLSQAGMVMRWRKLRETGWQRNTLINSIGMTTTFIVFLVLATSRFTDGAWIVIALIPPIVLFFTRVKKHYDHYQEDVRLTPATTPIASTNIVLVPAAHVNQVTKRALSFAHRIAHDVTAIFIAPTTAASEQLKREWQDGCSSVPLVVEEARGRSVPTALLQYIDQVTTQHPNANIIVVLPEIAPKGWRDLFVNHRTALLIKLQLLLLRPRHIVVNVPFADATPIITPMSHPAGEDASIHTPAKITIPPMLAAPNPDGSLTPATTCNIVIVPIARVDRPVARTLAIAHTIAPEVIAVSVTENPAEAEQLHQAWQAAQLGVELQIIESPYRTVTGSLIKYLDAITEERPDADVVVMLSEIAPKHWWHHALHNQTAQLIKLELLLFRPKQIVASVPYQLMR